MKTMQLAMKDFSPGGCYGTVWPEALNRHTHSHSMNTHISTGTYEGTETQMHVWHTLPHEACLRARQQPSWECPGLQV